MSVSLTQNREVLKRIHLVTPKSLERARWGTLALQWCAEQLQLKFLFLDRVVTQDLVGRNNYGFLKWLHSRADLTGSEENVSTGTKTQAQAVNKPSPKFFRRAQHPKAEPQSGWYPDAPRPRGFGVGY